MLRTGIKVTKYFDPRKIHQDVAQWLKVLIE